MACRFSFLLVDLAGSRHVERMGGQLQSSTAIVLACRQVDAPFTICSSMSKESYELTSTRTIAVMFGKAIR